MYQDLVVFIEDENRCMYHFNQVFKRVLIPFTRCGCFGVIIAPFYWLIVIPITYFYLICANLLTNICLKYVAVQFKRRPILHGSKTSTTILLLMYALCIATLFSICSVTHRIIWVILTSLIYTFIGIVLNASLMFKYIVLVLSFVFYVRDCFNSIRDKFIAFNIKMQAAVLDYWEREVLDNDIQDETCQENTSYTLNKLSQSQNVPTLVMKDGVLKWNLTGVCLFLDRENRSYIPKSFFSQSCNMMYYKCPGSFFRNLVEAFIEIVAVFLFLFFVTVVVLALGENFEISASNQTLAILAGSLLPLLLKKCVYKQNTDISEIDISDMFFKSCLKKLSQEYSNEWPVADIMQCEENDNAESELIATICIDDDNSHAAIIVV